MVSTAPVSFLFISDTLTFDFWSENKQQLLRKDNTPCVDVILHCGTFSKDGCPDQLRKSIQALGAMNAELKLIILSNDDSTLDPNFVRDFYGASGVVYQCCMNLVESTATTHGVTCLKEGTHTFNLQSGATFTIYASPYTPNFGAAAFQYPINDDRFNPIDCVADWAYADHFESSIIHPNTDIVMTHGPPFCILDQNIWRTAAGCPHLRSAIRRVNRSCIALDMSMRQMVYTGSNGTTRIPLKG